MGVGSSRKERRPVSAPEQLSLTDPQQRDVALKAAIENAVIRLAKQLAQGHTEEFAAFLQFYSRFWTYSARNCLLIQLQCPGATRCAGKTLWNQLGYHIKRGGEGHLDLGTDHPQGDRP